MKKKIAKNSKKKWNYWLWIRGGLIEQMNSLEQLEREIRLFILILLLSLISEKYHYILKKLQ